MRHKISKMKVKRGNDSNQMLLKKLVRNFVMCGSMKTTMTKASYLKSAIESLSQDALTYTEANKNILLAYFGTYSKVMDFVTIAKKRTMNDTGSGIVKILKLGARMGDAAPIGQVIWSKEIEEIQKSTVKSKVKSKSKAKTKEIAIQK